jgi:hypothetical protein
LWALWNHCNAARPDTVLSVPSCECSCCVWAIFCMRWVSSTEYKGLLRKATKPPPTDCLACYTDHT